MYLLLHGFSDYIRVSLLVYDNIDISSDITHYLGHYVFRFIPSYGRFQYRFALYHDYEWLEH